MIPTTSVCNAAAVCFADEVLWIIFDSEQEMEITITSRIVMRKSVFLYIDPFAIIPNFLT
jgi:hypothetical protein